ncbi:MAG: hypothetical protein ABIW49_01825 [Knoellia sp.]
METLGGVAALAVVLGVPLGIILLTRRRRPIEDVVTRGSAHGQTGPSPAARDELATDAPVQRARALLAHPPVRE